MKKILIYSTALVLIGIFIFLAGNAGSDEYGAGETLFKKNCQFCHNLR
jgi:cytochrome c2